MDVSIETWIKLLPVSFVTSMLVEVLTAYVIASTIDANRGKICKAVAVAVLISYTLIPIAALSYPNVDPVSFFFVMLLPEILFESAIISFVGEIDAVRAAGVSSVANFFTFLALASVARLMGF